MTEEAVYKVKAGSFEGPLDLLLSLIENRKLFVTEISLAQVTDDYIGYIRSLSDIPAEKRIADVSYFILIAATLILIKSRSLLPNLALTDDEEEKIVNLEARLKLYQIIKTASIDVKNNFGTEVIFSPLERTWSSPLFSPDQAITISSMAKSMEDALNNVPKKEEKLPEVEVRKVINIETVINSLTDRIQNALNISFKEFSKSHNARDKEEVRVHVIVSFLAMLELVREGIIDVVQHNTFEDIQITKQEVTE
jgi:segregation and condensation protein A